MSRATASRFRTASLLLPLVLGMGACAPTQRGSASAPDTLFADWNFLVPVGKNRPPVDALFAPGGQQATAWLPDGTFWNGDFECSFTSAGGESLAFLPTRHSLHATFPAAWRAGVGTRIRAFQPWSGADTDSAGWTRVNVQLGPPGTLGIAMRSAGATAHPLHPDAPISADFAYGATLGDRGREARLTRDGRTLAIVAIANPNPGQALTLAADIPSGRVAPDQRVPLVTVTPVDSVLFLDVWLAPVGGASATASPPDRRVPFLTSAARTAAAWRTEMAKGASFEVPDWPLQTAFTNAQRLLVGNRERRNGSLHFLGSPFQYRDLYLRDGARVVHALALLGRSDLARQALTSLYAFQWPGGAFLSQRGQLDGTGQALWALGTYAALGGDPATVDRLIEPALRGARWIGVQRSSSTLRGGPAAGLLPYADPRDNELARGHLFGNDAWAIAGLEALAPLVRARGRAATADTLEAEARAYRATLLAAWDRAARGQGRPLPPVLEGGGRDWGNLSAAYPCYVVAPDDARMVALDRWLRANRSLEGLLTYGATDSVHHYLGFDRTQAALRRGDRAAFRADLEAILRHTQPDGSGFELASRDGGYGDNLPPHGTFAAMLVDLIRSSIFYERGDSLVLLAGAPANLAEANGARPLVVRGAPTRFGTLDIDVRNSSHEIGATMQVRLPAPATIAWPPPTRVRTVTSDDGSSRPVEAGRFSLPAGQGTWRIEFEPATGREEGQ